MRPSIVFGILSAAHRPETVLQLVQALRDYPVVIHHDFAQQPEFRVDAPNVTFVADYASSGWAAWGLMDSIARTIEFCGEHYEYDYLQFLTPVDLPIKPLASFESFIAQDTHDVAADQLALDEDELVFMTFAFRAYAAQDSLAYRMLWRAREAYFGADYQTVVRGGLSVPTDANRDAGGNLTWSARMGRRLTRAYANLVTRYGRDLMSMPMHAGSVWFGAKRQACEFLVHKMQEPALQARFKPLFCAPEMLISTVFAQSDFRCSAGNHLINAFDGARPLWFGEQDLDTIALSDSFFARKFPDDPEAPVRASVLSKVNAGLDVGCAA
ncbi:MAG: hypothetical protein AB8C46_20370 [Burkholderiaceae bacterium]